MKTETFEINIPFAGFYNSIHENEFECEIESLCEHFAQEAGRDIPESLLYRLRDSADWGNGRIDYAQAYVEAFSDEYLDGTATFAGMDSPQFYNFETDRIFVTIPRATLAKLWRNTDRATLDRLCAERHTSRDGFASHYRPDWREWGSLSTWDHNQVGTLLRAYLEAERGDSWDQWAEYELLEGYFGNGGVSDSIWIGDKAERALKLFDYLTERAKRPHKTMKAWARANTKPWNTTPLGAFTE
jgi:hypothetical protein